MSSVNECILIILLLAQVRVHFVHCSSTSGGSFERPFFQKRVQIIQQNVLFCSIGSQKPLLRKSRILKIIRVLLSFYEDRKRLFASFFNFKLTSSRKGPFCTFVKCFVLYHFGDDYGPLWIFCPFDTFFNFFYLFLLFFLFLSPAKKCPSSA